MRLLIHGMQSSGATAFTQVLAQRPGCVALIDIPNNFAAPRVSTPLDFVAKAVITTAYPLAVHVERFRPDRTVLLLRDPRDNYASLLTKPYRHFSGLMHEKFQILDQLFQERSRFDAVIHYEDLVARDPAIMATMAAISWPITQDYFQFRRSYDELIGSVWAAEPALREEMEMYFGNARTRGLTDRFQHQNWPAGLDDTLQTLCPNLLTYYRSRDA